MKLTTALFVAVLRLSAQTVIDSGSPTDSNVTGGGAYSFLGPIIGTTDLTMRSGSFVYDIPCRNDWTYIVKFEFFEPVVIGPGQRVFNVRVNNQVVLDHLDVFKEAGGKNKAIHRSVTAIGADEHLIIQFESITRTAIVSSISITPLFQLTAQEKLLHDAAWAVINTKCTRCHGDTGSPPDTFLTFDRIRGEVGDLDMRTREDILRGGKHGPAMVPGDPMTSRLYLSITRIGLGRMMGDLKPDAATIIREAQGFGLGLVSPSSNEDTTAEPPAGMLEMSEIYTLRDWILAGAP